MKKIAFVAVNQTAPWGGSEELWSQTALRMAERGFGVGASVRGWKQTPKQIQKLEQSNCAVTYRWYDKTALHKIAFRLYGNQLFEGWLDRFCPDLVVISQGINLDGLDWMEACLRRNIPYVSISQAAAENYWASDTIAPRLATAYQSAQKSFFVSQRNIDLTIKQIAAPLDNSQVVRNPFNVAYDAAPPWLRTEGTFKLACVGRLHPVSKGQDILFEVLRSKKWRNRPLQVTLFGHGPNENSLRKLKDLWSLDSVEFGQFTSNVEDIWKNHHALVLPSRYEGLPLVIIEAMLCGRPCIVTDIAGNTELVEDNVNGFVAKAPSAELLDEALEQAWQKRESWYEMGKAAALRVREVIPRDPIETFADQLEALLKDS